MSSENTREQAHSELIESMPKPRKKSLLYAFTSLRHRNYRLYWLGQLISQPGSWMQNIGLAWLVLTLTHSPWQLGLIGAFQSLPILLFSLFGGVFADRLPKRRVLFITQAIATVQAFLLWLLLVTGTFQLWHLYALAVLLGITNSLGRPTSRAFIPQMVGHEDLPNAVALNSSISTLANILGPSLGGVIIATSGVTMLFLLNSLSFLPVLLGIALMKQDALYMQEPQLAKPRQNIWQSLREGLVYCWKTPSVLLILLVVGLVLLFGSNFNVVLPLFATEVLHGGATGFGILSAAVGLGALLATIWQAWNNSASTLRGVLIAILVYSLAEVAFALSHNYLLSIVLIAAVGFLEITFAAQALTMLQIITPNHLSGRVMSVQVVFFDGSLPLGYILMGWLSGLYGPVDALLVGALLCLLVVGAGWIGHKYAERDGTVSARV